MPVADTEYRLPLGTVLAETYRIERQLGRGGMGEVYEASHARLSGRYAVKLLLREVGQVDEVLRRFKQEAEITSRLRHPNIVQVIDFAQMPDGTPFMVMEFLNGRDLAEELLAIGQTSGRMPIARALNILEQVANGLAAAHAENIVHRDLKPANIFLTQLPGSGRELAKIVDFGISKVRAISGGFTRTQTVIGTPQYMAPEQARGQVRDIDSSTDQFALGAIAYEMLSGHPPFEGEEISSILYQIVHETPPSLVSQGMPDLGPADTAIRRAMAKNRADRYPSVLAFVQALSDASRAPGLSVPPAPTIRDSARQHTQLATPWPPSPTTLRASTGELGPDLAVGLARQPPKRSSRALLAVVGGAAAAALATLVIVWGLQGAPARTGGEPAEGARPVADKLPGTDRGPPPPPPPQETEATEVSIDFENGPPGLQVAVDGRPTPQPLRLRRGTSAHLLRLSAPGYRVDEQSVIPSKDLLIRLTMQKEAPTVVVTPPRVHQPAGGGKSGPRPPREIKGKNIVTDL